MRSILSPGWLSSDLRQSEKTPFRLTSLNSFKAKNRASFGDVVVSLHNVLSGLQRIISVTTVTKFSQFLVCSLSILFKDFHCVKEWGMIIF